jgi:hypothetical protein
MRDAPTHDDLVIKARKAAALDDPMKHLAKSDGQDPSKVNQPENLLDQSDIVCFNGIAALVPKRAVLATPSAHKERLSFKPGSQIVPWGEFYAQNRGWITTVEVSRAQAEGNAALPEETTTRISKSRNLVVATYKGGPISVLPLKTPPPENPAEATPNAAPANPDATSDAAATPAPVPAKQPSKPKTP